ncbi:hypothetical protein JTE90_025160 [Oedothorax gibbosus]|uniref:Uncharacterized protein n=1 Tax=Oedothorax gibbosus TaxID=931172 RepID=A0AAV6UIM6_9ARAC|nr:hypothetical protein JTE90_025160 [Oedothorax gibbosus]
MSSKEPGSVKQAKSDVVPEVNPEWSTCNSFSSSSNDSAIFCDNSKRGTKRNRNSSGSSASSSLSCVSDKPAISDVGSSTVQAIVGQSRHNLRRNIVKKTCDCHCTETHTSYKRTSYERIEKPSAKEITIARTNIEFRVENNGKKEVHKVTYEKSFSPSKFDGQRSEVQKEFCLQNTDAKEVRKVIYKESFSPTKSETFCLGDDGGNEFRKLTYEESYSPSKSDSNRKRRSEVQKLYESLHEIEWAKDFSPDNILRQINVRQAASCSLFGRSKPGESPPAKRPKDELDAQSDSYCLTPIKLKEELHEKSDQAPVPTMKPNEHMDALQNPPKGLQEDLHDHSHATRLKEDMVVKRDALNPVKRLKFDLHDTTNSSSPPRLMEDTDNKTGTTNSSSPPRLMEGTDNKTDTTNSSSPPRLMEDTDNKTDTTNSSSPPRLMEDTDNKTDTTNSSSPPRLMEDTDNKTDTSSSIQEEQDCKSESPETIKSPPSLRTTRSATLKNRQRKVSAKRVVKYEGRRISRRINKNSSIDEQNEEDSNLTSVECFKLKKENLGKLKIKKHINIKNSSINCKISSSQEFSGNNLELPDSLSTFIPRMYHEPEADNSEFSLPPFFFDIAEEGIRTIDACFREVGAEVVISTCYEADSEIPRLTSVEESGSSDKAAIADDSPPVLEHCGACQEVDTKEFLEKPLVKHCQTEDTKDCQLENETSDGCKVSCLEDAKELYLENETLAISFENPDQVEECEYLMLEDGTVFKILGRVEGSEETPIENENLSTPCQAEDSKDFRLENETLAICESFDQIEDSKDFKLENGALVGSCEIFSQMDNSKEIKALATSCESAGQIEDSENIHLENETSAVPCENLGQVDDSKEFQLKIESLATSCESSGLIEDSKDFLLENKSLGTCEVINNAKDLQSKDETLARSCDPPGQIEESKEFQLEKGTLATSCENSENCPADSENCPADSENCPADSGICPADSGICPADSGICPADSGICPADSENCPADSGICPADSEIFIKSSESPCQIDSTEFQLQNEILVQTCESYQTENSIDEQVKKETLLSTCKMSCQIEDEKCQLQFEAQNSVCKAEHSKNYQIKNENETSGTDFKDSYKTQLSEDCMLQSQTLIKTYAKYHDYSFEDHCLKEETPSRLCITYRGESSKDLQFEEDVILPDPKENSLSDATDLHCVEINSPIMSETGMSYEEMSDVENKSDLDSVCSEESAEASQKRDFSEILKRIVSNRFKNDSLIKQAGKRILNKYLRILRCEERDEVSQQFYVSTKDIVSPVKKESVNRLEEPKMVVEISKQNVYKCKSPEKLTFNHSKSSLKTYSNNKELIHKNIPNKTLLVQEKNSNFYRKEPVATTHQPPKKDNLSTLPRDQVLKIDRSSTLACYYRTLLVHRLKDYTQVILRLSHFTVESLNELCDVLRRTERDPQCHALILNGIGESFGLGIDLRPLLGPDRTKAAPAIAHAVKNLIEALSAFKKPLVAVVNGAAHGLAMTVLNHADTVIASHKATFCLPQLRFGYFPEGGATYTLPRIVGATRATDLIMRSRILTAQEALQINLITEVFDEKSLPDDLVSKVKVYMKTSLTGMETAKAMLKMQTRPDLLTMLENEVKILPQMWLSDSCQETMARELYL